MNNFDLPRGILRNVTSKGVESTEYTLWTSVADTKKVGVVRSAYRPTDRESVMQWHFTAGAIGTAMLSIGYLIQVGHLIRKRRSDGVSPSSYLIWALAAALVLVHEWGIAEPISIFLTGFETVACLLIAGLAIWFSRTRSAFTPSPGPRGSSEMRQ